MIKINDMGYAMKPSLMTLQKGDDSLASFGIPNESKAKAANKAILARFDVENKEK